VTRLEREAAQSVNGASFADLTDAICDERNCNGMRDGRLVYRDANHLATPFAGGSLLRFATFRKSRRWPLRRKGQRWPTETARESRYMRRLTGFELTSTGPAAGISRNLRTRSIHALVSLGAPAYLRMHGLRNHQIAPGKAD